MLERLASGLGFVAFTVRLSLFPSPSMSVPLLSCATIFVSPLFLPTVSSVLQGVLLSSKPWMRDVCGVCNHGWLRSRTVTVTINRSPINTLTNPIKHVKKCITRCIEVP